MKYREQFNIVATDSFRHYGNGAIAQTPGYGVDPVVDTGIDLGAKPDPLKL
jgi:hypothetical protein